MVTFEYQAITVAGRMMKGTLEAASHGEANEMLAGMGLKVNSIEKTQRQRPSSRIGRNEFLLFNQQLASIAKANIPMERGLRELAADIESSSMRKLVTELAADLESGTSIEDAFNSRREIFPPLYGHILRAGIQTGRLGEMLTSLNHHIEASNTTRRIVFEAISYPLVVLGLAAVLSLVVFRLVVVQFRSIFEDMGASLPYATRICLYIAEHIIEFWCGVGIIIGVFCLAWVLLGRFRTGRLIREAIILKTPVLGRVYHRGLLGRLADSTALLVGAGCDMPSCLRLSAAATGSETMVSQGEILAHHLEQGENIIEAGTYCTKIPPLFMYSVQLGTQRNELQDNLYSMAEMYAQQVRTNQSRLQAFLMPFMLIIVGICIAFIILTMFLPMVGMLDGVG